MTLIAVTIFLVLAAIAALHVAWGFGVLWPKQREIDLVVTVVGYNRDRMPSMAQCLAASFVIFIPGVVALVLAGIVRPPLPSWFILMAGFGTMIGFVARGVAGYLAVFRRLFPRQPFASLDRRYYSPLCLLIAAGFATLLVGRLNL